jgi:uncharacterized membrane protein
MGILLPTILLSVLCGGMTITAATGKLSANGAVGIRTRATQRSPETWQAAHRAAAKLLVPASAVVLVCAVLALAGVGTELGTQEVLGGILLGIQAAAVIVSAFIAQNAANKVALDQFSKDFPHRS